jgi:Spy/CpxP family protein refolding chaperone
MFKKVFVKTLLLLAATVFLGSPASGLADSGMGYGPYPGWGHRSMHAWHHGEDDGPGFGCWGDLSKEDIQKLEKERADFFEATKNLRGKIYQKRLELKSELAKESPDAKKAAELQTEISGLKAEFDQKRLNHFLNLRKISPDIGRGFGGRHGMMGPGYGMGPGMMGPGYGMGPGMMGPGYGMGPGMMGPGYRMGPGMMGPGYGMGPGMMGPGYGMGPGMMGPGYGMGPGMMGPGYRMGPGMMGPGWAREMNPSFSDRENPQHMSRQMGPLEKKDAAEIVDNYIQSTRNPNLKVGKIEDSGNAFKAQIVTKDNSLVEEVLIDKRSGYMRPAY